MRKKRTIDDTSLSFLNLKSLCSFYFHDSPKWAAIGVLTLCTCLVTLYSFQPLFMTLNSSFFVNPWDLSGLSFVGNLMGVYCVALLLFLEVCLAFSRNFQ